MRATLPAMRSLLLCCLVVTTSCAREAVKTPEVEQLPPRALPRVISRTSLGQDATGVSLDSSGQRFVWIRGVGLHQVTPTGLVLTLSASTLGLTPPDFEDVAIIDSTRVALIARNEGAVVGLRDGKQLSRFCYLPEDVQQRDPSAWQLSRALAYEPTEDRLYVQPQTFTGFGSLTGSQLGVFNPAVSTPLEWQPFKESTFSAGGMAVASRERTYLGMGNRLYAYNATTRNFDDWWELSGLVTSIEGLALDRKAGTLLVLDGPAQELVELSLDGLK